MIELLCQKFGSFSKAMDILYVLEGSKPCARIMIFEPQYRDLSTFLESKRLCVERSNFKVVKSEVDNYSDKGEKIPGNSPKQGYYFAYIAKNREIANKAKESEDTGDHAELGLLLGYPP